MTYQQQTAFKNVVGKGDIAHSEQFLLFPQCFSLTQIIVSPFVHIFDIVSLFAAEWEEPKIGISGKGLKGQRIKPLQLLSIVILCGLLCKRKKKRMVFFSVSGFLFKHGLVIKVPIAVI